MLGRRVFDVHQFLSRLDWPLFRPAAGLNSEPLNLLTGYRKKALPVQQSLCLNLIIVHGVRLDATRRLRKTGHLTGALAGSGREKLIYVF
jgi:hypothetical protein